MQIQIGWLLQKPTDLDLHCLQRQNIFGFSRTRVNRHQKEEWKYNDRQYTSHKTKNGKATSHLFPKNVTWMQDNEQDKTRKMSSYDQPQIKKKKKQRQPTTSERSVISKTYGSLNRLAPNFHLRFTCILLIKMIITRSRSRWHAIANPHAFTTKQRDVKNNVALAHPYHVGKLHVCM